MKNIEELKSWFEDDKLYVGEYVKHKIDRLDEPEVLSEEFINEKAVEVYADTADAEVHVVFRMRDLQNLLVPKRELPVIPKFVAEWIEEKAKELPYVHNPKFRANIIADYFKYAGQGRADELAPKELIKWLDNGKVKDFMIATITGNYEVEEEQKYVVELPNPNNQLGRHKNVFLNKKDGEVFIDSASLFVNDITKYGQFALTEEEIKEDFEWAWTFAKPVEEMEE